MEQLNYSKIVQIEDVLEDKIVEPLHFYNSDKFANFIIKSLVYFNNSVNVKQSLRYIPYNDFHTGYNNLHLLDSNRTILTGKEQLDKNPLFDIVKDMPKGAIHHAHLYTFVDFPKIIEYILNNQTSWDDNLYICTDPNSNFYLWPFMLPKHEEWKNHENFETYKYYEKGIFVPPIDSESINLFNTTKENPHPDDIASSNGVDIYIKKIYVDNLIINADILEDTDGASIMNYNSQRWKKLDQNQRIPICNINLKGKTSKSINLDKVKYIYNEENYARSFFIKLYDEKIFTFLSREFNYRNTNDQHNDSNNYLGKGLLCRNVENLFPESEAFPSCIYEMWSFSQPFYDLWINMHVRQNIYNEKNEIKNTKDYLTKWDLLDITAEIGGSLTKHFNIFPYFFALTLLNLYYDDKYRIAEFRTPIGNIYENGLNKNGKFDRIKIDIKSINTEVANSILVKGYNIQTIKDSFDKITEICHDTNIEFNIEAFFCSIYHIIIMELVSKLVNLQIIMQDGNNIWPNDLYQQQSAEQPQEAVELDICENEFSCNIDNILKIPSDKIIKEEINKEEINKYNSCHINGSKKAVYEKIKNIINSIFDIKVNEKNNQLNVLIQKYNEIIKIQDVLKDYNNRVKNKTLPIYYCLIGAQAKDLLNSKIICNKLLPDIAKYFILSNFLQKGIQDQEAIEDFIKINIDQPDLISGYDLYGEEDMRHSNGPYEQVLIHFKELAFNHDLKWNYFFHAGENHNYIDKHSNLLVSLLLDTKRIGHGIRIIGSQTLMELVKSKGICIECCPISNQVLDYIPNLSFHPALFYLNNGMNVSISSDDQNLYGYDSVAYDHTAIINSWNLDLIKIKKIYNNSLINTSTRISRELVREAEESWKNWVKNFVNYSKKQEIYEKLLCTEYIKLKTTFNKNFENNNKQLFDIFIKYIYKDNTYIDRNYNEDIQTIFEKYLTNDFINNIKKFFNGKENIFFDHFNWYQKCSINFNENERTDKPTINMSSSVNIVNTDKFSVFERKHKEGGNFQNKYRTKTLNKKYKKRFNNKTRKYYM